jgi:hypothetical protein
MKKIVLSLELLLLSSLLCAQQQYIMPDFVASTVYYKEGAVVRAHLNYNLLTNRMIMLDGNQKKPLKISDDIEYVGLGLVKFVLLENDFGQIVMDGDKAILALKCSGTVKTESGVKGMSRDKLSKYLDVNKYMPDGMSIAIDSSYYLVRQKEYTQRFYLAESKVDDANQRGFVKMYGSKYSKEIAAFVEQHEINFKNHEDLCKLMKYCESLR